MPPYSSRAQKAPSIPPYYVLVSLRKNTLTLEQNTFVDLGRVQCVGDMTGLRVTQWAARERRRKMSDRISTAVYGGMSTSEIAYFMPTFDWKA